MLPGGRVEDIWIAGVHDHIGDTRPLPCTEHIFPGFTAVAGLVKTSLATWRPQGPLHCREHRLRIIWVNKNGGNVLGIVESHVGPCRTAVIRSVNTIPKSNMTATDVLPGAHPNGIWI